MNIQAGKIDKAYLEELEESYEEHPETLFEKVSNKEHGRGDSKKISDPKERQKQRDERLKRQSKFNKLDMNMEIG